MHLSKVISQKFSQKKSILKTDLPSRSLNKQSTSQRKIERQKQKSYREIRTPKYHIRKMSFVPNTNTNKNNNNNKNKNKNFSLETRNPSEKQQLNLSLKHQQNQTNDAQVNQEKQQHNQLPETQLKKLSISKSDQCEIIINLQKLVPSKKNKSYNKFDPLIDKLKIINPFFSKLPNGSAYILLKIGKVIKIAKEKIVYQLGSPSKFFYLILYGKVMLKDKAIGFLKFSKTGQSLAQQSIFTNKAQYNIKIREQERFKHIQFATTQTQTCLLQVKKKRYYELEHQMYQKGNMCKVLFTQIDNSLKINYLAKCMTRNQTRDKTNNKCVRRSKTTFQN